LLVSRKGRLEQHSLQFLSEDRKRRRGKGGQRKRYEDHLRLIRKACDIPNTTRELTASERVQWRSLCHTSPERFEAQRIDKQIDRRRRRKKTWPTRRVTASAAVRVGVDTYTSWIGMFAHQRRCRVVSTSSRQTSTNSDTASTSTNPHPCHR